MLAVVVVETVTHHTALELVALAVGALVQNRGRLLIMALLLQAAAVVAAVVVLAV